MVIDQARRLHEGVANCGAYEAETPASQVFAQESSFGSLGRDLRVQPPSVLLGGGAQEGPQVLVETPYFPLYMEKGLGIGDGRSNLLSIADDAGILEQ